ncbi:MAG: alpha/beta fold hydrolase [Candidatus Eremiobacteraeota bacterium]|nr:alpha/beta fold hydrolase [Candidatus Eremiobacteraeota bacterium]
MTTFDQCFRERLRNWPEARATAAWSYAQLNRRANRYAWTLLEAGLQPEQPVILEAVRQDELLAALLGLFKAGGVYVPIDPQGAPERKQLIRAQLAEALEFPPWLSEREEEPPPSPLGPGQLAYILFTSGSTGVPKGAMLEQAGLFNHLISKVEDFGLEPGLNVAQTAAVSFDISVWQLLAPLLGGACCHIFTPDPDPQRFLGSLQEKGIHLLELVPTQIEMLLHADGELPDLRYLLPTGEVLRPDLCRRWLERFPHTTLVNAYGPTECCDDVMLHFFRQAPDAQQASVPLGRPVKNVTIHLLNDDLEPVEAGEIGEICVGGVAVGRGYLKDPERTARVFLEHTRYGRLFRTGDLGRYQQGELYFLERRDFQVKVGGVRLELEEVEAALLRFPGVRQAAALVRQGRVQAFVAPEEIPIRALRRFLADKLEAACQPGIIVRLPELPRNAHGKIDRKQLPDCPRPPGQAPRDAFELALVTIFEDVLQMAPLGVEDDFFECGGQSLLALELLERIQGQLGVRLSPAHLLSHPTPARLADCVRRPLASSLVIQLKGGEGVPLVLLPGAGGTLTYFYDLVERLPGPILGCQARGLQPGEEPFESIEAAARTYLALLPEGPIRLLGHSLGGWVAYEMARLRPVESLIILDMPAPLRQTAPEPEPDSWLTALGEMVAAFYCQPPPAELAHMDLAQVAEWLQEAGILPPAVALEQLTGLLEVYRAHHALSYCPQGELLDQEFDLILSFQSYRPQVPWLGWEGYCRKRVRLSLTPGDHLSCLRPPLVDELVWKLGKLTSGNEEGGRAGDRADREVEGVDASAQAGGGHH